MNHHGDVAIDISSRHGQVSDRMREYAQKKAEKLIRYNDQTSRIEVVVDGPHESPEIEMVVHMDHHDHLVATAKDEHFNAAMDSVTSKMERQLVKLKEKTKNHKGETGLGHSS